MAFGTVESLCHAVLFAPLENDDTKRILNILLLLPLINDFEKFLVTFNLFGLTFTKHRSRLTTSAKQHHQVSPQTDDLMTQRLALVVKTILDVFPGFLLDDELFQSIILLLDTLSLHDDGISNNLKISIAEKQNVLNKLTSFSRTDVNHSVVESLLNVEKFLSLEVEDIADQVHQINVKFNKVWCPQLDYSLLYDSKYNKKHVSLNPLVFNNAENVHYLGRLLISHLFSRKLLGPKQRAEVLTKWIQLGCKLEKLGDMVSWLAIATVVCSIPVLRLATTWQFVPEGILRLIFKDWVPTIVQLERRQMTSKPTNTVFILAPPNLNDLFIRENVIPYFGDLVIHTDALPSETKFKYLEKKIHRTKNAFYKWQQRLQQANEEGGHSNSSSKLGDDSSSGAFYHYWKYHLDQPPLHIDSIMQLSLDLEPPTVNQRVYSNTGSKRSSLLSGSYLPMLFNEILPNYSLFPQKSLVGAAGVSGTTNSTNSSLATSSVSSRSSRSLSISGPINVTNMHAEDGNQVTGIGNIDEPATREISSKQSNKQRLLKSIRDVFNIDMDLFHVSDDIIFKSVYDIDGKSRPASVVIETPKRMSQQSSVNNSTRDSQDINRLSSTLEGMDFFNSIAKATEDLNESSIKVVLKSATLDKVFDVLVLTTSVFSKLVDTKDLENYYYNEKRRQLSKTQNRGSAKDPSIGLLDYAFVKLTMDNDVFTETFFNTYKSFTTTTTVLENLAKRFIGAKSCAVSITRILNKERGKNMENSANVGAARFSGLFDVTANNTRFPAWDLKITERDELNYTYIAKIQIGTMEAILHLVSRHYADFTDDLSNNRTFLDVLKIMDQEVNDEWAKRLNRLEKSDLKTNSHHEMIAELEGLHTILKDLFSKIKFSYQKQLYRPLRVSRVQRKILDHLENFTTTSILDWNRLTAKSQLDDPMLDKFHGLAFNNYSGILEWIYELDELILDKLKLVTNKEWIEVSQVLELFSNESLVSFFQYSLHTLSSNIISTGGFQVDDLEIVNIFKWISTLSCEDDSLFVERLPHSVQLLVKLHLSLTEFFILQIAHLNKSYDDRVNSCAVILQMLNFARWKNSTMDLFHDADDGFNDNQSSAISPHVPSFIETAITNAIIAPESRCFEMSWKHAYTRMVGEDAKTVKSISDLLRGIEGNVRSFVEYDGLQLVKPKNLCPCPGWFIGRLLEISQFVPNMSIENSKMINFDKRRFVNNIVVNFNELIPDTGDYGSQSDISRKEDNFGTFLFHNFIDAGKQFRKYSREVASTEAKQMKFQTTGLFNDILVSEVGKVKRDQRKMEVLTLQERDYKRAALLQQTVKQKNRISTSQSTLTLNSNNANATPSTNYSNATSIISNHRNKRSSMVNSSRSSIISNSSHNNGVGRKIGGFFKRPFSIGGFSNSASSHSLNSILINGVQNNGSVSPYELPEVVSAELRDVKPSYSVKTFEIKSCIQVNNYKQDPHYIYTFKIIMGNGNEHLVQASSADDLNDWLKSITLSKRYSFHSKKYKGKTSNKIFGVPIEDVCEREGSIIPNIVVKLLEEIELRGLDEVGLYRIPGSVGSINALKNAFDEEGAVSNSFTLEDDRWFEINTIAGCFKLYLRELPESLFTNEKLSDFTDLVMCYKASKIEFEEFQTSMRMMLKSLPVYNYHMIKRISGHLNRVHQHMDNNRMDATNLAIVFSMSFIDQDDLANSVGPRLGALQTILQYFIKNPEHYFN